MLEGGKAVQKRHFTTSRYPLRSQETERVHLIVTGTGKGLRVCGLGLGLGCRQYDALTARP